ncbi:MAG TPA: FGGY family carbohydrate kinase, partial [Pirellulales bacterium]|nr:FGGY family carbohydrate kinase [Pirellulales bacterium]
MNQRLTMAIDAGTGSCRAVLFDEGGVQVAIAQRDWSHAPVPGVPGSQSFDTERNWRLIGECSQEALARAGVRGDQVAAVAGTSMREGMVLYDAADREIWACPNVDSRAGEEAGE